MKGKIIAVLVMMLLIVTTIPAVGIKNEYKQLEEQHVLKSFNTKAEETIIINPIANSSVLEDIPDNNFGNLDALLLSSSAYGNERIYLKFDVSSIPDGAIVNEVILRLYCFSALDDSVDAWMWGIEESWDELTITWNNQPFDPESDTPISIRMMTLDDSESWCEWPMAPEHLQSSEQNLMVKTEPESISGRYRFDSRESGENMPELVITYTKPRDKTINKIEKENSPLLQNCGVDQEQTTHCSVGMNLRPPLIMAQSFKPSVKSLTAVQLWLLKGGTPPDDVEITVSIRDALNGTDLTAKTINADDVGIPGSGKWVHFCFDDITVIAEETYYIVCQAHDGSPGNCYNWFFDKGDKYTRGEAWYSNTNGVTWITLWEYWEFSPEWEEPDFCFKTYFKQSRDKSINKPFLNCLHNFLQSHPNLFPLLQKLLQQQWFGL